MARLSSYSQHFLRSTALAAELIGHSNIKKTDTVYDFGAGSGVISAALAMRAKQVVAVENEPAALGQLRQNLGGVGNVDIYDADMLQIDLPSISYKVFSNPPFSLSSKFVTRLAFAPNPPKAIYTIVQRQFAQKLVPSQQHFTSALGATIAPLYVAKIRKPLKKTDFTPPPAVDTVLLELLLRDEPLVPAQYMAKYREYVTQCFAEQKYFARQQRQVSGISPERKPSELTPEEWATLYRNYPGR